MPNAMSDSRLTTIHLKDLQTLMDEVGYTAIQQEEIRARRRKLQNRHSAKTSSARKRKQFASMTENSMQVQHELQGLRNQIENLRGENVYLRSEAEQAQQRQSSAVHDTGLFLREIGLLTALLTPEQQTSTWPEIESELMSGASGAAEAVPPHPHMMHMGGGMGGRMPDPTGGYSAPAW